MGTLRFELEEIKERIAKLEENLPYEVIVFPGRKVYDIKHGNRTGVVCAGQSTAQLQEGYINVWFDSGYDGFSSKYVRMRELAAFRVSNGETVTGFAEVDPK